MVYTYTIQTHKAFNTMSAIQNISLYIPHVFANYSKHDITSVFEKYIGEVKNVDLVAKIGADSKKFNAVYIHFHSWHNDIATRNFQARVLDPNLEARLVYEDPWYWICLENKSRKVATGQRKPRIDLGDLNTQPSSTNATTDAGYLTPVKEKKVKTPNAPVKSNRLREFTYDEIQELEDAMDEQEAYLQEQDQYLVSVDCRYIQAIEDENNALRNQCAAMEMTLFMSPQQY